PHRVLGGRRVAQDDLRQPGQPKRVLRIQRGHGCIDRLLFSLASAGTATVATQPLPPALNRKDAHQPETRPPAPRCPRSREKSGPPVPHGHARALTTQQSCPSKRVSLISHERTTGSLIGAPRSPARPARR